MDYLVVARLCFGMRPVWRQSNPGAAKYVDWRVVEGDGVLIRHWTLEASTSPEFIHWRI